MSAVTSQVASQAANTFTPEDLLRLSDGDAYELVGGKLVGRNVSIESSRIAARTLQLLANAAERTGEASVYPPDLGYQCFPQEPAKVRRPDVSVIRRDRLAAITGDQGYMTLPADLAVEVVSPNDLSYDVREKVEAYLQAGFGAVWVVYPNRRIVDVHRPGGATATLHEADELGGEPALPSFRCKVADLFRA